MLDFGGASYNFCDKSGRKGAHPALNCLPPGWNSGMRTLSGGERRYWFHEVCKQLQSSFPKDTHDCKYCKYRKEKRKDPGGRGKGEEAKRRKN